MSKSIQDPSSIKLSPQIWLLILIIVVGWSRYLPLSHPELFNFTPVLAIFLLSGSSLKGHISWSGPVIAVVVSDLILNPSYGQNLLEPFSLITIFVYMGVFLIGKSLRKVNKMTYLLGGALLSSLLFHFITCGFAWVMNPAYAKNISGFIQAQFLGEPGYAPAYLFLRNSTASTLFFTAVLGWIFQKKKAHSFVGNKNIRFSQS